MRVTIIRDEYGVPHVQAPTDPECVFGLMFAQAEDHFAQIETQIIGDVGRAAEVFGPSRIEGDLRFQLFEIEARAKKEYASSSPAMKKIADAYADGLNYFVAKHPEVKPRLLGRFEPWFMFANQAGPGGIPAEAGTRSVLGAVEELTTGAPKGIPAQPEAIDRRAVLETGSNAWAIAPKRTTGGHAILFSNPHVSFFGADVRYECHVHSGEGWDFSGFVTLGNPIPHAGHNAHLGWTHTNTIVDTADVYAETPVGADMVKYGSGTRPVESWTASMRVKTETGFETRKFKFRRTHHGPIIGKSGDRLLALKWQHMDRGGYWSEKYAMGKARNMNEFRRALSIRSLPASNTTYADDAGHIAFWYGNAAPKRPLGVDPSKILDGADPKTEWLGYHEIDELPHVSDPASGWLQNCNSDPEHTTADGNPIRTSFRKYLIGDVMTARAENSRRILASQDKFSYEDLEKLAFDTTVFTAIKRLPIMLAGDAPDSHDHAVANVLKPRRHLIEPGHGGRQVHVDDLAILGEVEFVGRDRRHNARRINDQVEPAQVVRDPLEQRRNRVSVEDVVGEWQNQFRKLGSQRF